MAPRELILAELRQRAAGGVLRFDQFVEVALFHPGAGYYAADRVRVGRRADADFTTAAALGPVFGELVAAAAAGILGDISGHVLVEVGAEPGTSPFAGAAGRFSAHRIVRLGDRAELRGPCVLVANELLDAQPFRRLRFLEGRWVDLGVRVLADGTLAEAVYGEPSDPEGRALVARLPVPWHEGATLDISLAAETLLDELLAGEWTGVALLLDYGKPLAELLEGSPAGTARAYRSHRLHGDLLAEPGEQDLTCHVAWDRLESVMRRRGFAPARTERQEAFLVRHAGPALERLVAGGNLETVGALKALTHPAHFGGKFQVLWGRR